MAFSYRKPGWIRRKIFKQPAALTLTIGEPLFANPDLDKTAQIDDLTVRMHESVCHLAGYDDGSLYPALFKDSKRIDY